MVSVSAGVIGLSSGDPASRFHDIVPKDAVLERVSHGHIFTEGPVWNSREGALYWTEVVTPSTSAPPAPP